jgi:ABC-type amino acid transport substrate-binding protein
MFRQGNDTLVEAVMKALAEMKEDGTYLEISEKVVSFARSSLPIRLHLQARDLEQK